jgi:hypothetical protein
MMIEELETVALNKDLTEHDLKRGDKGSVVHRYSTGKAFEVEFLDNRGNTKAVVTLTLEDLQSPSEANQSLPEIIGAQHDYDSELCSRILPIIRKSATDDHGRLLKNLLSRLQKFLEICHFDVGAPTLSRILNNKNHVFARYFKDFNFRLGVTLFFELDANTDFVAACRSLHLTLPEQGRLKAWYELKGQISSLIEARYPNSGEQESRRDSLEFSIASQLFELLFCYAHALPVERTAIHRSHDVINHVFDR